MLLEMRLEPRAISLLLCILCIFTIVRSTSIPKDRYFGISPEDVKYYKAASEIKCRDGTKKFTKDQLNDDFCDCPDGTDEPGTSACPYGKFYCQNTGHAPILLFSSRVNDGICDCCDGSDEYDGKIECQNTCWEAGKAARDKLRKKIATYRDGLVIRKQKIEQAKIAFQKDEAELTKLKNEEKILKGLVQQLKDHKEQIEKAEEKERLQKEKEEKEKKEAESAAKHESVQHEENTHADEKQAENKTDEVIGNIEDSPSDQETVTAAGDDDSPKESTTSAADEHVDESIPTEKDSLQVDHHSADDMKEQSNNVNKEEIEKDTELTRAELGRLVASRWTGEKTDMGAVEAKDSKHVNEEHEKMPKDSYDEDDIGYASETDYENGDTEKFDNDADDEVGESNEEDEHDDSSSSYKSDTDEELDLSDTATSGTSFLEKVQQTVRNLLRVVNVFQAPVDKSEADRVRKEYEESSSKLSKIQSRISSLTKKLHCDFGPEKEFFSFYGQCFEIKQNKYVYKVCPYKQASQMEGHSTTRLGEWDKFEDSYQFMLFSNGDHCWNGPDRSLKVKLRCGVKNELADVDEPSRCEYVALLTTPARCLEDKLRELQQKLDSLNQTPHAHDEL